MADEPKRSLLAGAALQGELIPIEELPDGLFYDDEHPGMGPARYTGERFFLRRPDDYRKCVSLLAGGIGMLEIARLLKVHHMTVAAVREREGEQIDILKERIRKNLRLAVGIAAERLPEIMAKLPDGQVPLSIAILIDKLGQMDGEPTQRIEVTHTGHLTHESVIKNIEAFPDAIEVVTSTGLSGESAGQKALGAPADPAPGASVDPSPSDSQSGTNAS